MLRRLRRRLFAKTPAFGYVGVHIFFQMMLSTTLIPQEQTFCIQSGWWVKTTSIFLKPLSSGFPFLHVETLKTGGCARIGVVYLLHSIFNNLWVPIDSQPLHIFICFVESNARIAPLN